MPKKGVNSKNKNRFHWKTIAVITPLIISLVLIGNIIYCTISPSNISQDDLDNRIPLRSLPVPPPSTTDVMKTIVSVSNVPTALKLTYTVHVNSPSMVEINSKNEFRLTRKAVVNLTWVPVIEYEGINDYSASLDGNSLTLKVVEINGTKYYGIPDFNLTNTNEVRTLVYILTDDYYPVTCSTLVKIPWVFSDNYAQMSNVGYPTIPVEKGSTSDACKLRIDFNLPYRKLLVEESGWLDAFVNPKSGLTYFSQNQSLGAQCFEYPIEQTVTKDGNFYTFQTFFSQQTHSNQPTMTFVADFFGAPLLLISFLASPFLMMFGWWLDEKRSKGSSGSQSKTEDILGGFIKAAKIPYTLPLATAGFITITTLPTFLNFFSFIYEIINPVVLGIIVIFPTIFYFIYAQFKK